MEWDQEDGWDAKDDRIEFIKYLAITKGLMDRTVTHYMGYYDLMDHTRVFTELYCHQFIQDHKNHSVVRGMMLNLLAYRKLENVIRMPPKKTGSVPKRIVRDVGENEIKILKEYLYNKGFKFGLMFELIYQGALRRVEVPTIKISSFKWMEWTNDMTKPCQLIVLGKRDKERTVLINPETVERLFNHFLKKYPLKTLEDIQRFASSDSLIFEKLTEHDVYDIIHRGSVKCLGRDIRPHELRHARATELEELGVAIRDIKVYLGHCNLTTTEIYLHTSDRKSIDNISGILEGKK